MDQFAGLLLNAAAAGLLLGGFYAAVALGIEIAFGMLDIPNLAHPAFVILGSFAVFLLNAHTGLDPLLCGIIAAPAFFALGAALYQLYHALFERHGASSLQGLSFFFGILFITEVGLVLTFGADYRSVNIPYSDESFTLAGVTLSARMLVAFAVSLVMVAALHALMTRTFLGRAMRAVSQDSTALRLMAISPYRVKRIASGLAMATAAIAGALLIIIQPVDPTLGEDYIGRAFAVVVLGGMDSLTGMLAAALLIGVAESVVATFYDPSWAPAISFGLLLPTLALRGGGGLLGRAR